jgi:hypothetical protein
MFSEQIKYLFEEVTWAYEPCHGATCSLTTYIGVSTYSTFFLHTSQIWREDSFPPNYDRIFSDVQKTLNTPIICHFAPFRLLATQTEFILDGPFLILNPNKRCMKNII